MELLIIIILICCTLGFALDKALTNNDMIGLKAENKQLRFENGRLKELQQINRINRFKVKTIRKEYKKLHEAHKGANETLLKSMINDIDCELQSLDGRVVGSVEHSRRQALRDIKKYLTEVLECELKKR